MSLDFKQLLNHARNETAHSRSGSGSQKGGKSSSGARRSSSSRSGSRSKSSGNASSLTSRCRDLVAQATSMYKAGSLDESITCLKQAIELDDSNKNAWNNLGFAHMAQKNASDAIVCYRRAIVLDPQYAPAHHNLGSALEASGKLADATKSYMSAVKLDPKSPKTGATYLKLGMIKSNTGCHAEAAALYQKALGTNPHNAQAKDALSSLLKGESFAARCGCCFFFFFFLMTLSSNLSLCPSPNPISLSLPHPILLSHWYQYGIHKLPFPSCSPATFQPTPS
jgi:tetratricopeptide (TPR) repeat protein